MYDVFYSFNILNTSFNIGFCITVKRLEQSWFVRYINVYYYYYYYYVFWLKENVRIFFTWYDAILECTRHFVPMFSYEKLPCALQDGVI